MSQELAQDEAEADADDYEIADLEARRPMQHDRDDDGYGDESTGFIHEATDHSAKDEDVVFALEDEDSDGEGGSGKKRDAYKDMEEEERENARKRD
jgi:hypothetical protein